MAVPLAVWPKFSDGDGGQAEGKVNRAKAELGDAAEGVKGAVKDL